MHFLSATNAFLMYAFSNHLKSEIIALRHKILRPHRELKSEIALRQFVAQGTSQRSLGKTEVVPFSAERLYYVLK